MRLKAQELCLFGLILGAVFSAYFVECWFGDFFLSLFLGALSFYVGMKKILALAVFQSLYVIFGVYNGLFGSFFVCVVDSFFPAFVFEASVFLWFWGFGGLVSVLMVQVYVWRRLFRKFFPEKVEARAYC